MKATMPVTVEVPQHYVELDEQGARNYYRARQRKAFLEREVVKPFEEALREYTGFSDKKIPREATEVGLDLGETRFSMKCTPTAKRPSYETVLADLRNYLENAREPFNLGTLWAAWKPKGKNGLYIPLSAVEKRVESKQEEVESQGVKIEIVTEAVPENVLGDAQALPVPLNGASRELTESNARVYLGAKELLDLYKAIVSDFESALIGLTGYSNSKIPEETTNHWESLGEHLFRIPTIPYASTCYAKVMGGLTKEDDRPEKAGDWPLLREGSKARKLRKYDARKRRDRKPEDRLFVSVNGTISRIDQLTAEQTTQKVRQRPIEHYPLV